MGEETTKVDLRRLAMALGIKRVRVVDPYDLKRTTDALKREAAMPGPSLIITNRPCILMEKFDKSKIHFVNKDACQACGMCLRLGCPSISPSEEIPSKGKVRRFKVSIDPSTCRGCTLCKQVCRYGAIYSSFEDGGN
jgi:indolepyruvate ferredoxin oxidoreductase alpha subunit